MSISNLFTLGLIIPHFSSTRLTVKLRVFVHVYFVSRCCRRLQPLHSTLHSSQDIFLSHSASDKIIIVNWIIYRQTDFPNRITGISKNFQKMNNRTCVRGLQWRIIQMENEKEKNRNNWLKCDILILTFRSVFGFTSPHHTNCDAEKYWQTEKILQTRRP